MLPFLAHHYISDRVPSFLASKGYIRPKESKTYEIKRRYRQNVSLCCALHTYSSLFLCLRLPILLLRLSPAALMLPERRMLCRSVSLAAVMSA